MYRIKLRWIKLKSKIGKIKRINFAVIIFGITMLLLLSIVIPGFFQRYLYYSVFANNLELPYELEMYGSLISENESTDYSSYTVYVGGYSKKVEEDGSYEIDFLSETRNDIVIVVLDENDKIYYYSKILWGNEERKKLDIRIRGSNIDVSGNYNFRNGYDMV